MVLSGPVSTYSHFQMHSAWAQGFCLDSKVFTGKKMGFGGHGGMVQKSPSGRNTHRWFSGTLNPEVNCVGGCKEVALEKPGFWGPVEWGKASQ